MNSWIGIIFAIILLVGVIGFFVDVWRTGIGEKFFFGSGFVDKVIIFPTVVFVVFLTGNWIQGSLHSLQFYLVVIGVYACLPLTFYSLGFLHGLIRRRRNEGIIG